MAEFTKITKEYSRMCDSFNIDYCRNCPINSVRGNGCSCKDWTFILDPETSEKVILNWAKKNPVKTNAQKFEELFGFDFKSRFSASVATLEWLEKEYKEDQNG